MTSSTTTPPSPAVSASKITKSTLNALLLRYDALITHLSSSSPSSLNTKPPTPDLKTLDHLRYTEIPHRLAARKKDGESIDGKGGGGGGAHLEKAEVEDLVRWKLSHGTFRPRLTQLVASNSVASIRDTTRRAFALYAGEGEEEEGEAYMSAIKTLATLKGIGPATASLLLAVFDPVRVPFFADELYWWVCCGGEWGTGIRYTVGEYKALWEGVRGVRGRLDTRADGMGEGEEEGVRAVELEKAAWVLGWEARGGGGGGGKKGRVQATGKTEKEVATKRAPKKRKIANGSRADVESRPDDEREIDNFNDSTPSSPAPLKAPNENLTTSASTSVPIPDRPISPPPPKRQLSHPNPSNSKNEPTADRQLRRSKRTKLP